MPFVCAGAAVLLFALIFGMGSVPAYIVGAVLGAAGFMAGRLVFPDRTVEVEAAPKSGDAQVDALITEARAQLDRIAAANAGIADAGLTARIDDIEQTGRKILAGSSGTIGQRIDEAAATVQEAFHKQLSALDEFRFINLESEMDALRQMMASDGLTEDGTAAEAPAGEEEDPFSGLFSQGGK